MIQKGFTIVMGGFNKVELFDENRNLILRSKISKNQTFQISMEVVENFQCMSAVKDENCCDI